METSLQSLCNINASRKYNKRKKKTTCKPNEKFCQPEIPDVHICIYEVIQGCFKHWAAVALFSGSSSNMVRRKELNWEASS